MEGGIKGMDSNKKMEHLCKYMNHDECNKVNEKKEELVKVELNR